MICSWQKIREFYFLQGCLIDGYDDECTKSVSHDRLSDYMIPGPRIPMCDLIQIDTTKSLQRPFERRTQDKHWLAYSRFFLHCQRLSIVTCKWWHYFSWRWRTWRAVQLHGIDNFHDGKYDDRIQDSWSFDDGYSTMITKLMDTYMNCGFCNMKEIRENFLFD